MDDLAQLQSRVEAARERLGGVEADQRKYGLRLDDLVRIVEGALSRQSADLQAARIKSASLETELDDARTTIARHEVNLAAKDTDLARLETQNEQLRSMVMTLLELVEGRNATPMREAMIRLEHGVRNLLSETTSPTAKPAVNPTPYEAESSIPAAPTPVAPAPTRPVLVPQQTVQGRIPTARPMKPEREAAARPAPDASDALIELTALGRANPAEIVMEPPETPPSVAQILRRIAPDSAAAGAVATDA